MEYERPLTIEQAAEFLNYSLVYFRKLVGQGLVPYYKPLDGRIFFKTSELCEFAYRNKYKADYELQQEATTIINKTRRKVS